MKKVLLAISLTSCSLSFAYGQTKSEQLYMAVSKGDTVQVKQLLKDKADPNYILSSGPWMKVNPLITAVNRRDLAVVRIMLANKADVNWKDGFNTSALMYAAATGQKEIFMLLLNNGANIKDSDGRGNTVMSAAQESKDTELIKLVEEKIK